MIANCRNGPLSANQDCKKNFTISRDHELQKCATFCKSRSQEKLYNFSRKTIQFLVITNCRNGPLSANYDRKKTILFLVIANCGKGPLSANHDRKKNFAISQENYTISCDRQLQKWATFCKSQFQEKLCSFSRKLYSFSRWQFPEINRPYRF